MSNLLVSFEGGPIIIGVPELLSSWEGIESADYESLCELFDADESTKVVCIPGKEHECLAADFGGPGTIRVFRNGSSLVLVRAWHKDPDSDAIYTEAVMAEARYSDLNGMIEFSSDTIAIAWAAESLSGVPLNVSMPTYPRIDVSIDGSVLLYPLGKGRYHWVRSELSLPTGSAVRLGFEPVP